MGRPELFKFMFTYFRDERPFGGFITQPFIEELRQWTIINETQRGVVICAKCWYISSTNSGAKRFIF